MKQGGAIMPDALRWLWRGYPEPIVVHEPPQMKDAGWDSRAKVYSTVWADKPWEQVGASYGEVVNPTGDDLGDVFFADGKADRIYKADPDGKVLVFQERAGGVKRCEMGLAEFCMRIRRSTTRLWLIRQVVTRDCGARR